MTYTPVLILHICAGIVGVFSGYTALFVRKGGSLHRKSGQLFVLSMLLMAAGGAYSAVVRNQPFNVFAGILTMYLVVSGWATVARKEQGRGRLEVALLVVALIAGIAALLMGSRAERGGSAAGYYVFAFLAFFMAAGDVRMYVVRGVISRTQRLARHLWRMCFALFIAAGSFFLGMAGDPVARQSGLRARLFPEAVRQTHINAVPVILIWVVMLFWLGRLLLGRKSRKGEVSSLTPHAGDSRSISREAV